MAQSDVRGQAPAGEDTAQADAGGRSAGRRRGGRGGGGGRGGDRKAQRRQRRRRVLRWSAIVLAVVIVGTAGAGYLYYEHLNDSIQTGKLSNGDSRADKTAPNAAGQTPLNILLIGSDDRDSAANLKLGGAKDTVGGPVRGDMQMLIHLSADRKSAAMVTIPRDTRVHVPECKDSKTGQTYPATDDITINSTLSRGGAGCTLATWEDLTGVYIDHWMTIDFAGVVRMADAIGGVDVCVNQNVWDHSTPAQHGGSGLKMTAGHHQIRGKQALQWLRTRHAWGSDQLRGRAQHMYLNSMMRTLQQQNVFTDSGHLMDLANAAIKSLKVSEELNTVKKLYGLAMELKSVPANRITSLTMPNIEDPRDKNHNVPDEAGAAKVWQMLRDDVPFDKNGKPSGAKKTTQSRPAKTPSLDPAELGVLVRNATQSSTEAAVDHRASAIGEVLAQHGYSKAAPDTSGTFSEDATHVRYPSADLQGDAQAVAKALGIPLNRVAKSTDVSGVTVVVGADWREGATYPKKPALKAGDVPGNADAINGSDNSKCMDVYGPYQWS